MTPASRAYVREKSLEIVAVTSSEAQGEKNLQRPPGLPNEKSQARVRKLLAAFGFPPGASRTCIRARADASAKLVVSRKDLE
jgi:hypothetical protein